jgi:hypothetical protein
VRITAEAVATYEAGTTEKESGEGIETAEPIRSSGPSEAELQAVANARQIDRSSAIRAAAGGMRRDLGRRVSIDRLVQRAKRGD